MLHQELVEMPRGGARSQSGPPPDPNSGRSERRGLTTAVLPAAGYRGQAPGLNQFLPKPSARHREVWKEVWSYPQALVWINEPWRHPVVAELVRLMVLTEQDDCAVGVWSAIRQRRDDLGLSTAGRRQEGWEIVSAVALSKPSEDGEEPPAGDEVGERRQRRSQNLRPDAE